MIQIGILVGVASTCIQSIGLTLQRKSHLLEDEKRDKYNAFAELPDYAPPYRPAYRRRRWQIGMALFVISNLVGSTIQITTLPLPVLSTLQATGLVFNTVCASLILHEPFTRWSFIGTALIAGGAVLIALFGALAEPSHTLTQLLTLLGRQQFLLWMFGTLFLNAVVLFAIFFMNRIYSNKYSFGLRVFNGFAFGGVSAILAAHSLLVAKSAVELIVRTIIDKNNQFNRWESWLILLALVFFALTQLYYLHRGLKLVSTSILYPFVFCIYNIIAILDGLIYFDQASRISPLHGGLIALGTVVLLSGVLALSWRSQEDEETAPPPDAHTLLTPGFGLVEDTTTEDERDSDIDEDNASITSADEEAALAPSEVTPLLSGDQGPRIKKTMAGPLLVSKSRQSLLDDETSTNVNDPKDALKPNLPPLSTHFSSASLKNKKKIDRRTRSATVSGQPLSRHSTPSPTRSPRPGAGLNRASTVHADVDFRGPVHSLTWRERDREMRRRRWGRRASAAPNITPSRDERGRSLSTPLARRRRWRAGTEPIPRSADEIHESNASGRRSRMGTVTGWVGRLFSGGRPASQNHTNNSATSGPPNGNER